MKKVLQKHISVLLTLCLLLSMAFVTLPAQAEGSYYSYTQSYDGVVSTSYGFLSEGNGNLVFQTDDSTYLQTNMAMINTSAKLESGKTYRVTFDLEITRAGTGYSVLSIRPTSSSSNVWSDFNNTPLWSNTSLQGKTGTVQYAATVTANEKGYLMFCYTTDSNLAGASSEFLAEFTIGQVVIAEVFDTVTATSESDAKGTVTVANADASRTGYAIGEKAVFTAAPKDGFYFAGWYNEAGEKIEGAGATYEMTVTGDTVLTAKWNAGLYQDFENYGLNAVGEGVSVTDGAATFTPSADETTANQASNAKHRVQIADLSGYLQAGDRFQVTFRYKTAAGGNLLFQATPSNPWASNSAYSVDASDGTEKEYWSTVALTDTNDEWKQYTSTYMIYTASNANQPYLSIWFGANDTMVFDDVTIRKCVATAYDHTGAIRAVGNGVATNGLRVYNDILSGWISNRNMVEYGSIAVRAGYLEALSTNGYTDSAELTYTNLKDYIGRGVGMGAAYSLGTDTASGGNANCTVADAKSTLWETTDTSNIYTAYLTGIDPKYYGEIYQIRSYAIDANGKMYYGNTAHVSVFDVANAIDVSYTAGETVSETDQAAFAYFVNQNTYAQYEAWCTANAASGTPGSLYAALNS